MQYRSKPLSHSRRTFYFCVSSVRHMVLAESLPITGNLSFQIFTAGKFSKIYLARELGTATAFLQRATEALDPTTPKAELRAVLGHIIQHMLDAGRFADVPASVIPENLSSAFYALLDEELILRRDLSPASSIFTTATENNKLYV